jgi:Pentapeptide repeats (9 copies)
VISVIRSKTALLEGAQSMPIKKIIDELFSIYDLSDLMSRPFLLFMVIDVLKVHKLEEMIDQKTISPAILYSIYIESYLKRDWDKGKGRQFLTPLERRTFAQCMALSMLYKSGRLSVTLSEISPVLKRVMNEKMTPQRRGELETNIQSIVSDVLLCAFLRLTGEDMFEFVHKSFMEYFAAEFIAETLVSHKENEIVNELSYELNQEILQFIGGLSTAFGQLKARLVSQLEFSLPLGPNTYRKNVAGALLYSNKENSFNIESVYLDGFNFRRKRIKDSRLMNVRFQNCIFTETQFSASSIDGVEFVECNMIASNCERLRGELVLRNTLLEHTSLSSMPMVILNHSRLSASRMVRSALNMVDKASIELSDLDSSTIILNNRMSMKNAIIDSKVTKTSITNIGCVKLGDEINILKNPQLKINNTRLHDVRFLYPIIDVDLFSLDEMRDSTGIFMTSGFELKGARNAVAFQAANANVNSRLSPFLALRVF